jgi:eukaryotic-like serine/threonine-protein kinase
MSTGPTTHTRDGITERRVSIITPGQVIAGRYEIRRLLGRGGMGEVWLAFDLKLRVDVALKDLILSGSRNAELVRREVRAAREVVSPNVCRIFDLVEADGRELLSMEYVDGRTLRHLLEEKSPLDLSDAQPIASQFLAGLEAIHGANLVHRDLKPENVMITRTGRVVIMDFGLARETSGDPHSAAGTPAYMSPEQAIGEPVDTRSDVFAAGVMLAEMVTPSSSRDSRVNIWTGIRQTPPRVGDTPWSSALRKAVAREREQRFESARDLSRALDEVTLRAALSDEKTPYPGLSAFTSENTRYFFGREAEIETLLRKIERFHMVGLIGPSGAGKTSFLHAGVLPMLPRSWGVLHCNPGSSPFVSLGQALATQMTDEPGIAREIVPFHEPAVAVALLARWRQRHDNALIVIDQFEELFTLNRRDVQSRFSDVIAGAIAEADVRFVLSMRDDFLIHCHQHESLTAVFTEINPLDALSGAPLRRALVQPALISGYRFENEGLIAQMLDELGSGRGTLPLLAFAASQLWERRDREAGVLTASVYEQIGGVSGALAQHADATLRKIGPSSVPFAREIFRNLVTAQGTRAAREYDELLSVFAAEQRTEAGGVLKTLVDARLLTSFEVPAGRSSESRRIEIVHESLLTSWPTLVQWSAQDADGIVLRDQLRQAAQLWDTRGRPVDLLWRGTALKQFEVWRERYAGALSEVEEAFASAMIARSLSTRRRARIAAATIVTVAIAVAVTTTSLWRDATTAGRRAEAQKLLALGQLELERYPTAALAWFAASLEENDSTEARQRIMDALWRGPVARILEVRGDNWISVDMSRDGQWLALVPQLGQSILVPDDGGPHKHLRNTPFATLPTVRFSDDGHFLVSGAPGADPILNVLAVSSGELVKTIEMAGLGSFSIHGSEVIATSRGRGDRNRDLIVESHVLSSGLTSSIGRLAPGDTQIAGPSRTHPSGQWVARYEGSSIQRHWLGKARTELLWAPREPSRRLVFDTAGMRLASIGQTVIEIWSEKTNSVGVFNLPTDKPETFFPPRLSPDGSRLVWGMTAQTPEAWLWDLDAPSEAATLRLPVTASHQITDGTFDAEGRVLATSFSGGTVAVWNLAQPRSLTFKSGGSPNWVRFTPDGRWLVACGVEDGARLISLRTGVKSRVERPYPCQGMSIDRAGTRVLISGFETGLRIVPTREAPSRELVPYAAGSVWASAFDWTGRTAAVYVHAVKDRAGRVLRLLDVETGAVIANLPVPSPPPDGGAEFPILFLAFAPDGSLYSAGDAGVRQWNVKAGTNRLLYGTPGQASMVALSGNGRYLLIALGTGELSVTGELFVVDLQTGARKSIQAHGSHFQSIGIDHSGSVVATRDSDGAVRVSRVSDENAHLLLGLSGTGTTLSVTISPDQKWVATASDSEIRMWPMPDLSKPPLHTLPRDVLLAKLKTLTNVRVERDPKASSGYRVALAPFPGWKDKPTW